MTAPLVLSCGEPAGIGPEIAWKAWHALGAEVPFAYLGDPRHVTAHLPGAEIATVGTLAEVAAAATKAMPVLPLAFASETTPGTPDPANAPGVIAAIAEGVALVRAGEARALVTGPIHKKALIDGAGFAFPGHTEYLAHLAGDVPVGMMLACRELRVVPATIHIALSQVPDALTPAALEQAIRLTVETLRSDFGLPEPRLAIAGLNPHAGEGGAMGLEEQQVITPVLERLRAEGLRLDGPLSADTMFHPEARARYDAAVAMYHDQALIPIKTIDFAGGVNVTMGLPFVRTSPDHGTALDIAGHDRADPGSLIAALRMAAEMAARRHAS